MKKLARAIPNTPTKRVDVIKTFIKSLSPSTKQKLTSNNIVTYHIISEETINLVVSFYEDDSISRVMPGKRDVLSATDKNGTKIKIQFGKRCFRENQLLVILNRLLHWPKANILNSLLRSFKQLRFVKQQNI